MSDRVCQDGCEAYRLFGTSDEFMLEGLVEDFRLQSIANDRVEDVGYDVYREWSLGLTAWKIIGFTLERGWPIPPEVSSYLQQAAKSIDDWSALNGHPGELGPVNTMT